MTLESSKNMGGIGAILAFIGVPASLFHTYIGGIITLIGVILMLVAFRGLANIYGEKGIFSNALWGVILGVVGVIVAVGVTIAAVFANLGNLKNLIYLLYPNWDGQWSSLAGLGQPSTANINPSDVLPLIGGIIASVIVVFIVLWVFAIVASFFVRRSAKEVTAKSNVGLFGTAGLLMLIGAVLIIAIGFGLILMWIAVLLFAVAFFQLKPPEQAPPVAASYPPPPTSTV